MKLKCINTNSNDHRFTVGRSYSVVGSEHKFGKMFYTVIDNTQVKFNVPLNSKVYHFEVIE
ncbi:MAG: hypothetical protein Tp1111DCM1126091_15 [Prokaryotic dsDNA virus sp.]|nr:MAG: hypothetical protein Tp1111DCM1126091_15 [Prokaryotic dsDNA virus sp.]